MNREDRCEVVAVDQAAIEAIRRHLLPNGTVLGLAELFKVLGDPTRVRIIHILSLQEMCVCNIAAALDMSQSAISHQLRLLRNFRLVKYRKEGKSVYYSLDDDHIRGLYAQGLEHLQHA